MSDSPKFWYNTKTNKVEQGLKSLSLDRLGPFDSESEALRALEIIANRAKTIQEEDLLED
jgi:hypothetical protein